MQTQRNSIASGVFAGDEKPYALSVEGDGSLNVNVQDQTTTVVDFFFREVLGTSALAAEAVPESNSVTVTTGHGFVIGDTIVIKEWSAFFQADVLNVATDVLTLDSPIDFPFAVSAVVQRCNKNMAVNGSVTPRTFFISPKSLAVDVDVTHVDFFIEDNAAMDTTTFGGIAKLTRWVVLRRKDGIIKNYFNVKNNGEFGLHCDMPQFTSKIGGGEYSVFIKKYFAGQENSGVAVRLLAASEDEIQVIVQDDLTGLSEFHAIAHGHVVQA